MKNNDFLLIKKSLKNGLVLRVVWKGANYGYIADYFYKNNKIYSYTYDPKGLAIPFIERDMSLNYFIERIKEVFKKEADEFKIIKLSESRISEGLSRLELESI